MKVQEKIIAAMLGLTVITTSAIAKMEADIYGKVQSQAEYSFEVASALVQYDDNFRKKITRELLEQFNKNGYADFDNYNLHNLILDLHFSDMKEKGKIEEMKGTASDLDNDGKINFLHQSLSTNL